MTTGGHGIQDRGSHGFFFKGLRRENGGGEIEGKYFMPG